MGRGGCGARATRIVAATPLVLLRLENRGPWRRCSWICVTEALRRWGFAARPSPHRCSLVPGGQCGDLDEVVGEDSVAAPGGGAVSSVNEAAVPAVAALEVADASSDPVRHLISSRKPGECSTFWRALPGCPLRGITTVVTPRSSSSGRPRPRRSPGRQWLLRDAAEPFGDAIDPGASCSASGGLPGLDLVVEHQPVFVVDNLGFVPNSTGLPSRPFTMGRASGSCRLTSRVAESILSPAIRRRVWRHHPAARMTIVDSSLIALRNRPRRRPVTRAAPAGVVQHRRSVVDGAAWARSASSPVSRSTVACASCLPSAPRNFSFAPIACTFAAAISVASRNTMRVARPAALIRPRACRLPHPRGPAARSRWGT